MEEIIKNYNGKLYEKKAIEKWELPEGIKETIEKDDCDYFFLTTSRESQHGERHVHFTIYPTKYNAVNLLEVVVPEIIPLVLHETLKIIKEKGYDIITSTGFCTHENKCHFGVFFSVPSKCDSNDLILNIKKLDNIFSAKIFKYTCEGCFEA